MAVMLYYFIIYLAYGEIPQILNSQSCVIRMVHALGMLGIPLG